jgi:aryl-alcohol dehydrogenase-like predicted oxidoreductase
LKALAKAREEGLTRFIGVTGHGLRIASMHLRSLEAFDYDSVLLPYNFSLLQNVGYRSDVESLLAVCDKQKVAVQTIKSVARRRWSGEEEPRFSWYEPIAEPEPLARAVGYVLSNPQLFLITSSDARLLRPTLQAAARADERAPTEEEMNGDVESLAISALFDGAELERI